MENTSHISDRQKSHRIKTIKYELIIKKLQNSHKETSMSQNQQKDKT